MQKLLTTGAIAVLLTLLCGCGGSSVATHSGPAELTELLELRVLHESFEPGGRLGSARAVPRSEAGELFVDIVVQDAAGLRALYFELDTGRRSWTSVKLLAEESFGSGNDVLTLAVPGDDGVISAGQILSNPQEQPGFSGNGVVATLCLGQSANPTQPRSASGLPQGEGSRVLLSEETEMIFQTVNIYLDWFATLRGDYDQNGLVSISDLTPLAQHFGQRGPFSYSDARSVADGNLDGLISIADVTAIGAGFGDSIDGFRLYRSFVEEDYPSSANADNGMASLLAEYEYAPFGVNPAIRRSFQHIDHPSYDNVTWYYWLRPLDDGEEGLPSNRVRSGEAPPNLPSVSLTSNAYEGSAPLTVTLSAEMAQPDFPVFNYRFELNGHPPFEFIDNGPDSSLTVTFVEPGTYQPEVSAISCEGSSKTDFVTITVN